MRRFFWFIGFGMTMLSCQKALVPDDNMPLLLQSYVPYYISHPLCEIYNSREKGEKVIVFCWDNSAELYCSPDVNANSDTSSDFLRIAERNGDVTYNQIDYFLDYMVRRCFAENFTGIEVVCLNTAWDDTHPAGSLLNDLIKVQAISYAAYVRSGYTLKEKEQKISKYLSELSATDLAMVQVDFKLYFASPSFGSHEIQITLFLEGGGKRIYTCTVNS